MASQDNIACSCTSLKSKVKSFNMGSISGVFVSWVGYALFSVFDQFGLTCILIRRASFRTLGFPSSPPKKP
jgi:hypothetical protein